MARFGFIGPSSTSQSRNADCQQTMNFYLEMLESQQGKSAAALYPTPGLKLFSALPESPVRGQYQFGGRAFAVAGVSLYELMADGSYVNRGTVRNDGKPARMTANQNQLLVCSTGNVYLLTLATNVLTTQTMLGPVFDVAYCDSYFIALLKNKFQISALLDGSSWPGLQVVEPSVFPDDLVAFVVDHRELAIAGPKQTVIYQNTGSTSIFDPIGAGAFLEMGSAARYAAAKLDNTVYWLATDERGAITAQKMQGYSPQRISTHAIEFAWSGYATVADAVGYSYSDQGHGFWVLYFPTADKTWVFDVATQTWHERGFWNAPIAKYNAHRSWNHQYAFGKHLVGDWKTGNVYEMSITILGDLSDVIRRQRIAPVIAFENKRIQFDSFELDLETGLGPMPPFPGIDTPTATVLQADDGSLWALGVTDLGELTLTALVGDWPVETLFLNDLSGGKTWEIHVVIDMGDAKIASTRVSLGDFPQAFQMVSLSGSIIWQLRVTDVDQNNKLETLPGGYVTRAPMVTLSWSDDAGHTWSNEYSIGAGQAGEYFARVIWRRLGTSKFKGRIFKVACSDPIPWRLIDAYVEGSPGLQPSERLSNQLRKGA
jgi:hypothetical protein